MKLDDLGPWLVGAAQRHRELGALFEAFCTELRQRGSIINRGSLGLEGLDPEIGGMRDTREEDILLHTSVPRAGVTQSAGYQNSPMRIVDESGKAFRQRIEGAQTMPLLEELRQTGATDYAMFPMP